MSFNVIMPEMGEGVIEGTVVSWLKQEGEQVREDEAVLEVETDKVTVEINAESGGMLLRIMVQEGETVEVGTVLAVIGQPGEELMDDDDAEASASTSAAPQKAARPNNGKSATATKNAPASPARATEEVRFSPVVARMVKEHDLDVTQIPGTGRDGRITKKDVLSYMEQDIDEAPAAAPARPAPTLAQVPSSAPSLPKQEEFTAGHQAAGHQTAAPTPQADGEGQLVPLTGMRRAIAEHMVMSKRTSPHATTVFEFDFSVVARHRAAHKEQFAQQGVKLTYMPYIVQATVEALKAFPQVNASWTNEGILLKRDINLGMAVAVDSGLIVPVIRNADMLNLFGLAKTINDLADRARANRLQPAEVRGGTFTVTNHGASGSLIGAPIINQPQVGIVGVGLIEKRVKVINDAIAIRPCAYVSFSFDHRILDGASADNFIMHIKQRIENYT